MLAGAGYDHLALILVHGLHLTHTCRFDLTDNYEFQPLSGSDPGQNSLNTYEPLVKLSISWPS